MKKNRFSRTYATPFLALILVTFAITAHNAQCQIVLRELHGSDIGGPGYYGPYDHDRAVVCPTRGSPNCNEVGPQGADGDTFTAYGFTFRHLDVYTYSPGNSNLPDPVTIYLYQDEPLPSPTPTANVTDSDQRVKPLCEPQPSGDSMPPMAQYSIHLRDVSLNIQDRPYRYQPPRGPAVDFIVTYNQQETLLPPASGTCSNLGPKWTFNWLSYVTDDPNSDLPNVAVYVPNGGTEVYPYDSNSQSFARHQKSHALLVKITAKAGISYERQFRDGSKQVFALSNNETSYPRRIYMTEWFDAAGNKVTIGYDELFRITTLTDALDQVTTLGYDSEGDEFKIRSITEPFSTGRAATFDYTDGHLTTITDEIGIQSQFHYATGTDSIDQLTTPYGTTHFSSGQSGTNRWINITDPLLQKERIEYRDKTPGLPVADSSSAIPSGFQSGCLNSANTFFWDKKTLEEFPPVNDVYDYTKARITHWLYNADNTVSAVVASEKAPLEASRVYYGYAGQSDYLHAGSSANPTKVARVLDDGTTQTTQFAYNINDKLTKVVDPKNRVTSYEYAANGIDLLAVYQKRTGGASHDPDSNAADKVAAFTYDPNHPHLIASSKGTGGYPTNFVYNSYGQLLSVTNPKTETTTFAYDDDRDSDGDTDGYLLSVTGPVAGAIISYTYDDAKRIQTTTDSDSYQVTFSYDNIDRVTSLTFPDLTTEEFSYTKYVDGQDTGLMTLDLGASKDRMGRWTYREYNANRQIKKITDPLLQNTLFDWCSCGALGSITDGNGNFTSFIRDIQGRVTSKVFADNGTINYVYENTNSRLKSMTDALYQTTNYHYRSDDDLEQVDYSNAVHSTPTVNYSYEDFYNRVAAITTGGATSIGYSYYPVTATQSPNAGKLYQVDGSLANDTITYSYDELGRVLTQQVNGSSNSATQIYDALGRVSSTTNVLGYFDRVYDGVTPRLQTLNYRTSSSGSVFQSANYGYFGNTNDRRLQTLQNKIGASTNLSQLDYTYDAEGQVQTWEKTLGSTQINATFGYDQAKQLASVVQAGVVYDYGYDYAGNRLSNYFTAQHSSGGDAYTVNSLNQLDSVTRDSGFGAAETFPITYDANGNMTYDGANQTYEWDAANRLVAINYLESGHRTEFAYDGLNRRVRIIEKGTEMTALLQPAGTQYSSYDSSPFPLASGNYKLTFVGLNPNGGTNSALIDLVTLNGAPAPNGSFESPSLGTGSGAYQYHPTDTVWTFDGHSGLSGNHSDFTGDNPDAPDGTQAAFVENNGAISQTLSLAAGTYTLSFKDAQRANYQDSYQKLQVSLQSLSNPATTKNFVWCGNTICEERDGNNAVTKRFFAEGEQRLGTGGGLYYYSRDHLGSIREVTDASGNLVSRLDYDMWGNSVVVSGNMSVDFGFTGHYFHQPSGLNLTMYRAYSPTMGRWISRDPLRNAEMSQGPNLYTYVGNEPVDAVDPLGLTGYIFYDSAGGPFFYPWGGHVWVGVSNPHSEGGVLIRAAAWNDLDPSALSVSWATATHNATTIVALPNHLLPDGSMSDDALRNFLLADADPTSHSYLYCSNYAADAAGAAGFDAFGLTPGTLISSLIGPRLGFERPPYNIYGKPATVSPYVLWPR